MNTPKTTSRGFTQWDLFAGILPAVACLPLLIQQIAVLGTKPHMAFVPVTFVAFIALLFVGARRPAGKHSEKRFLVAAALLLAGTAALAAGALRDSAWLGQVAFVLFIGGWATGRFRTLHWGTTVGWTAFLASTIPLPRDLDQTVLNWVYATAASGTASILDALQVTLIQHGASIEVENTLVVSSSVAATWGSIFGLASLTLGICAFRRSGLLVSLLALALVPMWAWVGNLLRMTAIILAPLWYGRDLSNGKDYLLLHVGTFLLLAALIALSIRFLGNLFAPIPTADSKFGGFFTNLNRFFAWPGAVDEPEAVAAQEEADHTAATESALLSSLLPKILGIAAVLLMILPASKLLGGGSSDLRFSLPSYTEQDAAQIADSLNLPKQTSSGWQLVLEEAKPQIISSRGQYSILRRYANRQKQFAVLLSLPYLGWNDPTTQWKQRGWSVEKEKGYTTEGWVTVECELANELGDWRYVIYSLSTDAGVAFNGAPERLEFDRSSLEGNTSVTAVTHCLQLIAEPSAQLTSSELAEYRNQFTEIRSGLLTE